ncbi:MAG: KUP/HAK/KT family potassium transporter [Deltaproteobacteria bacterium]|nr:KUP/HAK/KT family potassium transporter [Deltaproteobacteria bacterium]
MRGYQSAGTCVRGYRNQSDLYLFAFQRKRTEKVAGIFGPLMVVWFLVLMISGVFSILKTLPWSRPSIPASRCGI